jgi:Tn3 transposase DDE domain
VAVRADVLTTLSLLGDPGALLAGHAQALDAAYREVGGRLAVNTEVSIDDDGKIHLTGVKAIEEPPSLVDLREVVSWAPELAEAFTPVSGGRSRLDDLPTSVAACLAAHAMNIGYRPVAKKGVPALERARLSHVFRNYVRPETLAAANAPLVARQAGLPLAQAWGGGLVAAVDGMRFVVPAAFARPNRKYFGSKQGMTWLNAINDHGMGRGAKIVSGTVRDSLHMVDVIFGLDGGELPEIVVSDPARSRAASTRSRSRPRRAAARRRHRHRHRQAGSLRKRPAGPAGGWRGAPASSPGPCRAAYPAAARVLGKAVTSRSPPCRSGVRAGRPGPRRGCGPAVSAGPAR